MPRPADEPKPNTLPDPELNPLLNPLLAANMGRWAEVYFTSRPEKREEAVAGLIRELAANSTESAAEPSAQPSESGTIEEINEPRINRVETEVGKNIESEDFPTEKSPQENYSEIEPEQTCTACGHINTAEQNFCGMCGTPLRNVTDAQTTQPAALPMPSEARWQDVAPLPFLNGNSSEYANEASGDAGKENRAQEFIACQPEVVREHAAYEPVAGLGIERNEVDPEESKSEVVEGDEEVRRLDDLPQFAREAEPAPYQYRLYAGTILAVLLTLLVYMAWRGTKAISSASGTQPPAARVIPPAPTPAVQVGLPAGNTPAKNVAVGNPPTDNPPANHSPVNHPPASRTRTENIPSTPLPSRSAPKMPAPKPTPVKKPTLESKPEARIVTTAGNGASIAFGTSGAEELATAENYLNGAQGKARDPREAVPWLWKSVSKGNSAATLVLSDLYLRGDGVAKSCDQARILLHAAARKGSPAAAERLRNLQPFGCP